MQEKGTLELDERHQEGLGGTGRKSGGFHGWWVGVRLSVNAHPTFLCL